MFIPQSTPIHKFQSHRDIYILTLLIASTSCCANLSVKIVSALNLSHSHNKDYKTKSIPNKSS